MTDRNASLGRVGTVALVAVGGFLGAAARHGVALALPGEVPWGALAANALGSFGLGVVLYERRFAGALSVETRRFVATGFLSSFTTYSAFALETTRLAPGLAAGYVGLTYALGFLGVLAGRAVVRWAA
jgi:CrcB protein